MPFFVYKWKMELNLINNMLQFILMVAASSVGEELFYRAAIQVRLRESVVQSFDVKVVCLCRLQDIIFPNCWLVEMFS